MLKHIHLLFVAVLVISFIGRVALAELKPALLEQKWLKISPHIIASLVLLTGFALVFQGNWLSSEFAWIVAKLLVLVVYVGLGVLAIRQSGRTRWLAFSGALFCLYYIAKVAVSKQVFFFF
ncbi:putative membrane protein SirB2 [Methylomonas methanica]|uniref:Invasion protein n=3 Tax=Methylococcaceae TaxID=403 RepID=A0A126T1A3_9GAMM|nr:MULTISPECIES: SirB2 family protein [Methylomonas]AMK75866.1 invasion protein [Methylomonas denitrificans]OAI01379.1 invasion protein [Methylomonas methanica]TCV79259.1 putative membrane protein SirB2 [Methylomonas methanica]